MSFKQIKYCFLFLSSALHAENTLSFKSEVVAPIHWFSYLLILAILCITLFFLAKKTKRLVKTHPNCQIIEKIPLHYKTKAYIIDYQGQRFLIADNQNALAIQPLQKMELHYEENS